MMEITHRTHFAPEDADCDGDYWNVSLWYEDHLLRYWGDSYHDKGQEKSEGFIEGLRSAGHLITVIEDAVNDGGIEEGEMLDAPCVKLTEILPPSEASKEIEEALADYDLLEYEHELLREHRNALLRASFQSSDPVMREMFKEFKVGHNNLMGACWNDEDGPLTFCGDCGLICLIVRPGKFQCWLCE